jgi:hypothetical protein
MKNLKALPLTGLIASCLLLTLYLLMLIAFVVNRITPPLAGIIHFLTPLLAIFIFLALRYILVNTSKLNNFKIVINLMIIFQILLFITVWIIKLNIITKEMIIPVTILGVFQLVLYVWFFILIFMIKKSEVRNITFLKYFIITFLLFFLVGAFLKFISEERFDYIIQLLKLLAGLSVIFLMFFFHKNLGSEQLAANS